VGMGQITGDFASPTNRANDVRFWG